MRGLPGYARVQCIFSANEYELRNALVACMIQIFVGWSLGYKTQLCGSLRTRPLALEASIEVVSCKTRCYVHELCI